MTVKYSIVTINCQCGKTFEVNFENTKYDKPIVCPHCHEAMDDDSWKTLRDLMGNFKDFNQHISKYHLERNEPAMFAESISWKTSPKPSV